MARDKSVRHELTRADHARRGVVAIIAIVLLLVLFEVKQKGVIGGPDEVSALVPTAGGSLASGADVKMRGVIVGSVKDITAGPDGKVRVDLIMNSGDLGHIPSNVVARILPATVFGTSFVDLVPAGGVSAATTLRAGSTVPADTTQKTLELQQALDDIDTLVKALDPAQLSATLGSISASLDGRGQEIGSMIKQTDALLAKVEPRLPAIRADIDKLSANVQLARQVAPQILGGIDDSLSTLHTIATHQSQLSTLLSGGITIADEGNQFLQQINPSLAAFLNNAVIVETVYYDLRHQAFTDSFALLRELRGKLASIVRYGWADTTDTLVTKVPPYYSSSDCPRFGSAAGNNCGGGR